MIVLGTTLLSVKNVAPHVVLVGTPLAQVRHVVLVGMTVLVQAPQVLGLVHQVILALAGTVVLALVIVVLLVLGIDYVFHSFRHSNDFVLLSVLGVCILCI